MWYVVQVYTGREEEIARQGRERVAKEGGRGKRSCCLYTTLRARCRMQWSQGNWGAGTGDCAGMAEHTLRKAFMGAKASAGTLQP